MKNRDEFIQSVWEKSEIAMAEEKARKRRRRQAGGMTAAAACLTLVIGITSGGGPAELLGDLLGGTSSDEATVNDALVMFESEAQGTDAVTAADDSDGEQVAPSCAGDAAVSCDGAPAGVLKMSDAELYGLLREETEAAQKSKDSDIMGYFCLPIGVEIASYGGDCCKVVCNSSEEEILKYMQWFYSLPEEQVLTTEEFENLKEIPTGYYKFTMDFSLGADTEGVDRIFYITGGVTLP